MISATERERKQLLETWNNQARILEQQFPADAVELNARLRELVDGIAARLHK